MMRGDIKLENTILENNGGKMINYLPAEETTSMGTEDEKEESEEEEDEEEDE